MKEMICTCSVEGHERAELLRLEVQRRLGVEAKDLATSVLLSLAWHFGLDVTVLVDQWFGVAVRNGQLESGGYIECDTPLDGLCYAWKAVADRQPERLMSKGSVADMSETRLLSMEQLQERRLAEDLWKIHEQVCRSCSTETKWILCAAGKDTWERQIESRSRIDRKWGQPDYEAAPRFYGDNGDEDGDDENENDDGQD